MSWTMTITPEALSRESCHGWNTTLTQRGSSPAASCASRKAEPALPSPTRAAFCCTRLRSSATKSAARLVPGSAGPSSCPASSTKAALAKAITPCASAPATATRSVSKIRR
jgi:hypothetical protein